MPLSALNHCHQTITIDATPEECFAAASGFEDYPKWAGAMKKVNVKKRQGRGLGTVVEWTMGILNLVDRPIFVYTYGRSYTEMKWHIQTPSKTIKNLEGRYTFKAVGSAKAPKTQVEYKLNVEPYIPFPTFVKKVINKGEVRVKGFRRVHQRSRIGAGCVRYKTNWTMLMLSGHPHCPRARTFLVGAKVTSSLENSGTPPSSESGEEEE